MPFVVVDLGDAYAVAENDVDSVYKAVDVPTCASRS
jgi:hypothetical protein